MNLLRQRTYLTPDLMFCHTGRTMSRWLFFIMWRVETGCLLVPCCVHFFSPMSFVRWHVWSQRDFLSHRNKITYSHTTYSSLPGVLWLWTMSHLCPMFSVSVVCEQKRSALQGRLSRIKLFICLGILCLKGSGSKHQPLFEIDEPTVTGLLADFWSTFAFFCLFTNTISSTDVFPSNWQDLQAKYERLAKEISSYNWTLVIDSSFSQTSHFCSLTHCSFVCISNS